MKNNEPVETNGIYIISNGDASVGITSSEWKLSGGFSFESQDDFDNFKRIIKEAFEYVADDARVESFEERINIEQSYKTMTAKSLAKILNGREVGNEVDEEITREAEQNNLVIVYGASDDLVELDGAISDEFGTEVLFDSNGEQIYSCDDNCTYHEKAAKYAHKITGHFDGAWTFETKIPHHTFEIMEDGELFCTGIVFDLDNLTPNP